MSRVEREADFAYGANGSYNEKVKLTLQLRLLPAPEQSALLLQTMERFNAAATEATRIGFEAHVFSQPSIHHRCYTGLRDESDFNHGKRVRRIRISVRRNRLLPKRWCNGNCCSV